MKKAEVEKIALRVINWCAKTYGWSKYHRRKSVIFEIQYQSDSNKKTYGEFDRDEVMIYVYTRTNRTLGCLVNTIIHEYQHYLQSPHWVGRHIAKHGDGLANPYERQAEMAASLDTERCIKKLKLKK